MAAHPELVGAKQFAELLAGGGAVILDCYADWCGPCKMIAPKFAEMAAKNPTVKAVKIDVDAEEDLAASLKVEAMPTFIAFKDGKEVDRFLGADANGIAALFAKIA
jgi:thioredoxin 1